MKITISNVLPLGMIFDFVNNHRVKEFSCLFWVFLRVLKQTGVKIDQTHFYIYSKNFVSFHF